MSDVPAAHRGLLARAPERVLRRGRVRARARRAASKIEQLAEEGERGAALAAQPDRPHRRVPVGLPARHHAGLDRHRLPRRAGDRRPVRASSFGERLSHAVAVAIAFVIAYLIATSAAHHDRRAGAEDLRDHRTPEPIARRGARPLQSFRVVVRPVDLGAQLASRTGCCAARHRRRRAEFEEATRSEDLKMLIAAGVHRRHARPGRGRHAVAASSTCTSRRRAR